MCGPVASMRSIRAILRVVAGVAAAGTLGLAAMIVRGFNASAEPTAFEASLAHAVRDLAIPRRAKRETNPLTRTPELMQEARDTYLARCASCHGADGDGAARTGRNLYPRSASLKSPETQSLTDGELHYIIAEGVQHTGMPAFDRPRDQSSGALDASTWQLVHYVRSLRSPSAAQQAQVAHAAATSQYTGSKACAKCHQQIYDHWQKTPMANVVRDPKEHPDAIIPDLATNKVAPFTKDQVALVYGSLWKQRYFTKVGNDYFPLGAQWDVGNKQWKPYNVPMTGDWWTAYYPKDNMHRPTGPTCDGCHSVNFDTKTGAVIEWNVGCERCHGPGSAHVATPVRTNILNPAHLDLVGANDTCIQCHSQGRPRTIPIEGKYYDWPVGYRVGLALQDFWTLEKSTLGATTFTHFPDGTAHKNRMQGNDFVQSRMYTHGVTCFSCHDSHGTDHYAQLRKSADKLCLDCHAPMSTHGPMAVSIEAHTRHKAGSTGSACIACHMPKIATEGVPGAFVRSHTFNFITPAMTDDYKMPNACTSCHADKSTAWATEAMRKWPSQSPWRAE